MTRKIVLLIGMSLDGYFEGPDRDISWHRVDEELHQHMNDESKKVSAFLEGRVTWELMADYWPTADQNPDASPVEVEFAGIWRDMPKYVFSRTLESAGWNTTVMREVDPDEIRALKAKPGGPMVVGGPDLAASFRRLGLIDEYWIYVHPVVLGKGNKVFGESDTRENLRLIGSHVFGNGVSMTRYERVD